MAEGRRVAAPLQLEARLVDAARGVDRQHELQVDVGLRLRRHDLRGQAPHEHRDNENGQFRDVVQERLAFVKRSHSVGCLFTHS